MTGYSNFNVSFWSEFTKPVGRRYSTIHQKVAARDECAILPHKQCGNISHFIRSSRSPSGAFFDHIPIARAAWPGKLILCQWRN